MGDKYDYKTLASAIRWMELPFPQLEEKGGTFCEVPSGHHMEVFIGVCAHTMHGRIIEGKGS